MEDVFRSTFGEEEVDSFYDRLSQCDASSIDTFLEGSSEAFQRIGKAAIAWTILDAERSALKHSRLVGTPPDDHWLGYVWNLMRAGCTADKLSRNRVQFVSFNYDRVLEKYFDTVVSASYGMDGIEAVKLRETAIPIVHLHGEIGAAHPFGAPRKLNAAVIKEIGDGIRIVHDTPDKGDRAFMRAYGFLQQADLVVFLGFGYHPTNLERLNLAEFTREDCDILGSAHGLAAAECLVARKHIRRNCVIESHFKCRDFIRASVPLQ